MSTLDRNTIASLLLKYSTRVIDEIQNLDRSKFHSIEFERIDVQNFSIEPFHVRFSYDFSNIKHFQKIKWISSSDLGEWLMSILYNTDEALEIATYIKSIKPEIDKKIIAPYILGEFSKEVSLLFLNKELTSKRIDELVDLLIHDIELEISSNTHNRIWLSQLELAGIHIECPEFMVSDNYSLKQYCASDFTISRPIQYIPELDRITSRSTNITTQLTLRVKAERTSAFGFYPEQIKIQLEIELNILRLFRVCSIYPISERVAPISLLEHGADSFKEVPFESFSSERVLHNDKGSFPLLLKTNELQKFIKFRQQLFPLISKIDSNKYLYGSYLEIAFHRYLDSLLRSDVYAYRILSAISCLEALFTMHETEVTFKLKSRLALLLSCVGYDPIVVAKTITDAYDLRSKIVHGGQVKDKQLEFARNSCLQILDFARISTIIFMHLSSRSKSEIIDQLNNALIDKSSYESLKKEIDSLPITVE